MDERLVEVYRASHIDADLIRSLLEENDVPALVEKAGTSGAYPVSVGGLGEGRVFVRESDEDEARRLIADAVSGRLDHGE